MFGAMGNWKSAKVKRGARREATPRAMRPTARALMARAEEGGRSGVDAGLASLGERRGSEGRAVLVSRREDGAIIFYSFLSIGVFALLWSLWL